MFGHRFFGARYFGPRYWGPGVSVAPVVAQQGFWAANPYKFRSAKQLREEENRLIQEERELLGILPKKVAKQVVKIAVNDAWRPTSDQIEALEAALYDARLGHLEEAVKVLRQLIQRQEEEILLFLM